MGLYTIPLGGMVDSVDRNAAVKLGAFGGVLAVVFAAALGVGAMAGPIDTDDHGGDIDGVDDAEVADLPRGLSVAEAGYRLVLDHDSSSAGQPTELAFEIVDTAGAAVTAFDELH